MVGQEPGDEVHPHEVSERGQVCVVAERAEDGEDANAGHNNTEARRVLLEQGREESVVLYVAVREIVVSSKRQ